MKSFVKQQHRLSNDSQQASQYSIFFAVLILHLAIFILIENDQVFFPKKEKPRERLVVQTIQLNPKGNQIAANLMAFEQLNRQSSDPQEMEIPIKEVEKEIEKIEDKEEVLEPVKEEPIEIKKEEKKEVKKEAEVIEKPDPVKEVEKPLPKESPKEPPPSEIPKIEKPIEKPKKNEKVKPKEVEKKDNSKPKPAPKIEKEPPKPVVKSQAKPQKTIVNSPVNKKPKETVKKAESKDKDKLVKEKASQEKASQDKAAKDKLAKELLLQQEAKAKAAELALKAKRLESLQKAQANMAKINKVNTDLLPSSSGTSIALPKSIHELHVDAIPSSGKSGSFSSHEMSYVQEIASLLKLKLKKLPEYGNVRVKLVLNRNGGIVNVTVLNAENAKNSDYIEGIILKMKFPSFGDNFPNEQSKSFDIKLVSDL